jgi:hypothetical protein
VFDVVLEELGPVSKNLKQLEIGTKNNISSIEEQMRERHNDVFRKMDIIENRMGKINDDFRGHIGGIGQLRKSIANDEKDNILFGEKDDSNNDSSPHSQNRRNTTQTLSSRNKGGDYKDNQDLSSMQWKLERLEQTLTDKFREEYKQKQSKFESVLNDQFEDLTNKFINAKKNIDRLDQDLNEVGDIVHNESELNRINQFDDKTTKKLEQMESSFAGQISKIKLALDNKCDLNEDLLSICSNFLVVLSSNWFIRFNSDSLCTISPTSFKS